MSEPPRHALTTQSVPIAMRVDVVAGVIADGIADARCLEGNMWALTSLS